jgi:hypothetical protein
MSMERRAPAHVRRELSCATCGRVFRVATTSLLQSTQSGWPKCCEEVMALRDGDRPAETDYELPRLRDDGGPA